MRAVIYDQEGYEPLTVVEVPESFMREIESGRRDRRLRFPIPSTLPTYLDLMRDAEPTPVRDMSCEIFFDPIYNDRQPKPFMWLCTTRDPDTALLLRSTFLPGQNREVQSLMQAAFTRGLMAAMGSR